MPLHALPVYKEETNFVLTREELEVVLNQEYRLSTGGKDVKITKTYDPSTGKITRQKFVDGEEVDRTKRGFKGVRRAKRAGNFGRRQRNRNNQNTSNKSTFNFGGGGNPFSVL